MPSKTPAKWVVDCKHVGRGLQALQYLSRYLYRGVISEHNILSDDGTHVTFQYRDSQTKTLKTRIVLGETFLWLVFQHVFPKGFRRVRDFGFLHGNAKKLLRLVQMI
ncbi:MAG: transposase, partial [Candidatus Thiodiazotropha sp.]